MEKVIWLWIWNPCICFAIACNLQRNQSWNWTLAGYSTPPSLFPLTHTHTFASLCIFSLSQRCRSIPTGRLCTRTPMCTGCWEKRWSWSAAPPCQTYTYGASQNREPMPSRLWCTIWGKDSGSSSRPRRSGSSRSSQTVQPWASSNYPWPHKACSPVRPSMT